MSKCAKYRSFTKRTIQRRLATVMLVGIIVLAVTTPVTMTHQSKVEEVEVEADVVEPIEHVETQIDMEAKMCAGVSHELYRIIMATDTACSTKSEQEEQDIVIVEAALPEEEVEEAAPVRENKLYYVMDEGIRSDFNIEYQDYLWGLCKEYELEEYYELFIAQIYHESGFNENCYSKTHDSGLMQINECNHKWLSKIVGDDDFFDPYTNMDAGVYVMNTYLEKYDVQKALVCYNMGEGGANKKGITSSKYSRGVLADMNKLVLMEE